jgi:hypothetical protein
MSRTSLLRSTELVASSLREMDYDGFVSGEWIDCAATIDLASELAHFRRLSAGS